MVAVDNNPVEVICVTKTINNRGVIEDISFNLKRGSLTVLIGPNGAGKSTLVKIILGLDNNFTGTVTISPNERIQYIPQLTSLDTYQLPLSVREYLLIGMTPLYRKSSLPVDLAKTLTHVGLAESILSQSFSSLSGGEQQRIAIARALLSDPTILVLDEPLASVDYASRDGLYGLIRHLQTDHKITVLLVSHDIESVLPISDRVLCLNKTLRTDCHPSSFTGLRNKAIHHHC